MHHQAKIETFKVYINPNLCIHITIRVYDTWTWTCFVDSCTLCVWIKSTYFFLIPHIYRIIQPQCLGGLVTYFSPGGDKEITETDAYLFAGGIVLCSLLSVTVFHPFILYAFQLGMRVRLTCCSLIYKKVSALDRTYFLHISHFRFRHHRAGS